MIMAAISGDSKSAKAIDEKLTGLHKNLFIQSNPIPVKWALAHMKRIELGYRLPLVTLGQTHHETVRAALGDAGLI